MRRFCTTRFLMSAATAFAIAASSGLTNGRQAGAPTGLVRAKRPVPNHYIVVLKESGPSEPAPDIDAIAMDLSIQHSAQLGFTYRHALRGFSVQMTEAQALAMAKNPRVAYVEEDGIVSGTSQPMDSWGLDRMDRRKGTNRTYNSVLTGAGVHAYVIDSGIDASNSAFGGRATADADFVNDGRNGSDCGGHGTSVAAMLGGATYGVAKGARLHGVRVLDCWGNGTESRMIAGVDWVTNNSMHPAIANMRLRGGSSYTLDVAVQNSIASGITYVVSAGTRIWTSCISLPRMSG